MARHPDRLAGQRAQTHRLQHMAGLHLAGAARRPGADGDPFQVERDHLHARRRARQRQAGCVRQPPLRIAAHHRPARHCRVLGRVAQPATRASLGRARHAPPRRNRRPAPPPASRPAGPRSCPPPPISAPGNGASGASNSAPTPAGPPTLCDETARLCAPAHPGGPAFAPPPAPHPHAAAHRTAGRSQPLPRTGWMTPVSLFASIRQTSDGTPSPEPRVQRRQIRRPRPRQRARRRHRGSRRPHRIMLDRTYNNTPPRTSAWIASASASVPPEVNTRSCGRPPNAPAIASRASSMIRRLRGPPDAPRTDYRWPRMPPVSPPEPPAEWLAGIGVEVNQAVTPPWPAVRHPPAIAARPATRPAPHRPT